MSQRILIDLFQMTMPMLTMNGKARFPNQITKLIDLRFHFF
jgi:hypothetical protein